MKVTITVPGKCRVIPDDEPSKSFDVEGTADVNCLTSFRVYKLDEPAAPAPEVAKAKKSA